MINFEIIGLTNRDKRVYEALISSEASSIRSIAEATGINRGSVYESLKNLSRAGLVSYITQGKTVRYRAENPEMLHEIINEKRRTLLGAHADVDDYVNELRLERHDPGVFGFASFYDGDEGMASILRDILTTCRLESLKEYKVIASPHVAEYLYVNFRHYTRERIKQGIEVKVLRHTKAPQHDSELSQGKLMPGSTHDTNSYTIIYGTKLAIISIDGYNHLSGIIITNEGVARTQNLMFDAIWNGSDILYVI